MRCNVLAVSAPAFTANLSANTDNFKSSVMEQAVFNDWHAWCDVSRKGIKRTRFVMYRAKLKHAWCNVWSKQTQQKVRTSRTYRPTHISVLLSIIVKMISLSLSLPYPTFTDQHVSEYMVRTRTVCSQEQNVTSARARPHTLSTLATKPRSKLRVRETRQRNKTKRRSKENIETTR